MGIPPSQREEEYCQLHHTLQEDGVCEDFVMYPHPDNEEVIKWINNQELN